MKPNHKFDDVVRTIAKGTPPEWLVPALEHFSDGIGEDTSDIDLHTRIERMQKATHALMMGLPIFQHLPYGIKCPKDVAVVLDALPRIKRYLDLASRKLIGRPPDAQRLVCAAVVARAWKIIHGKPEPRSDKLLGACSDYWRACGGEQIGNEDDLENWRRPVQRAFLHLVRRSISWKLRKRQEGRSRHVKCSWRARLIERKRCWSTVSVGVNSGAFVGLQWKHEKCSPRV